MQIQPISNYSVKSNQRQQHSPNFGKLIIDKNVPTELITPIAKNKEIQTLVKLFHNIGADIRVQFGNFMSAKSGNSNKTGNFLNFLSECKGPITLNTELISIKDFEAVKQKGDALISLKEGGILENLEKLKEGTAKETFNKYHDNVKAKIKFNKYLEESMKKIKAEAEAKAETNRALELKNKLEREEALKNIEELNNSL